MQPPSHMMHTFLTSSAHLFVTHVWREVFNSGRARKRKREKERRGARASYSSVKRKHILFALFLEARVAASPDVVV